MNETLRGLIKAGFGVLGLEVHPKKGFVRSDCPPARPLEDKHVQGCRVFENRERMLAEIPRGGRTAEVGVLYGDFSAEILRIAQPTRLDLIEIDESLSERLRQRFATEITAGRVRVKRGDSARVLSEYPDGELDWIYVDGDHGYAGVACDLELASRKVKADGWILVNDYIAYDHGRMEKYGVVEAVNELCLDHGYRIGMMALHPNMFCDVALRRR